jgi:uncharacterized protein (TIGR02001 family)
LKKCLLGFAGAALLATTPGVALADLAFNVGVVSDYRYRGISQSRLKPAAQAGVDYSNGGFYLGGWASTIKWIDDLQGDSSLEVDLYGGFKGELTKGLSYDVGLLRYEYPSNSLKPNANTTEAYVAFTQGPLTVKYSHALSNTFGAPDSKNSYYLDVSATFDLAGYTVVPHVGRQKYKGPAAGVASYSDYSLTVSRDIGGVVFSVAAVGSNADPAFYVSPVKNRNLSKSGFVLGAKYSF